ncbi:hypothetical protein PA10_06820 [Cutibacterium acnes P10]|jgi:hypothetical protein|nr:hypothetical protein [Cutibacterium acnes]MCM4187377.1 hypothetical protein [Cutibacterium acnes P10]
MASIGAIAVGLTGRARQLTLAFNSASWLVAVIALSYLIRSGHSEKTAWLAQPPRVPEAQPPGG